MHRLHGTVFQNGSDWQGAAPVGAQDDRGAAAVAAAGGVEGQNGDEAGAGTTEMAEGDREENGGPVFIEHSRASAGQPIVVGERQLEDMMVSAHSLLPPHTICGGCRFIKNKIGVCALSNGPTACFDLWN